MPRLKAKEGIIAGKLACLYVQAGQAGKGQEWFEKLQENPLAGRNPDLVRLEIEYYKHTHEYGKLVGEKPIGWLIRWPTMTAFTNNARRRACCWRMPTVI